MWGGGHLDQESLTDELKGKKLTELFHSYKILFLRKQSKVESGRQTRLVRELSEWWQITRPPETAPSSRSSPK